MNRKPQAVTTRSPHKSDRCFRGANLDLNPKSKILKIKALANDWCLRLREAYFGSLLRGASRVCRFVESFEEKGVNGTSLWLVFHNEGLSLRHYLYEGTVQVGCRNL